jgi:hypothetical protein
VIGCIFILSPAKADSCPFGRFDHLREREQFMAFPPFFGANQVPKKAKDGNVHSFFICQCSQGRMAVWSGAISQATPKVSR